MESNHHLQSKGGRRREWSEAQGRQRVMPVWGLDFGSFKLDKGTHLNLASSYTPPEGTAALSVLHTGFRLDSFVEPSIPSSSAPCPHLLKLLPLKISQTSPLFL